jgi:hypothetical protein
MIICLEVNPLSISPKGERDNHSFPLGGRQGRGSKELKEKFVKKI